jgi:mutual gliding-motility protein MglA
MAAINPLARELVMKIVFYGPGLGGKTTTLQHVHDMARPEHRGKMVSLATAVDRTLYFDFLPIRVPRTRGMSVRLQLFTVPGQVYYNSTRKLVLTGADGIVFVADSQVVRHDANLESLENLLENLREQRRDLRNVAHVIQYNKRDLPEILPVDELEKTLNLYGAPSVSTVATRGDGVFESLSLITKAAVAAFNETLPAQGGSSELSLSMDDGGLGEALLGAEPQKSARTVSIVTENLIDSGRPARLTSFPDGDGSLDSSSGGFGGAEAEAETEADGRGEAGASGDRAEVAGAADTEAAGWATPEAPAGGVIGFPEETHRSPGPPRGSRAGAPPAAEISGWKQSPAAASLAHPAAGAQGSGKVTDRPQGWAVPAMARGDSFTFAGLWGEGERELVRELEASIASRAMVRAVELLDALATRVLAGAGALLGTSDAPRDAALVPLLLGVSGPRYLSFRALIRDARAGIEPDERAVLSAYAFVIELRLARARVGG